MTTTPKNNSRKYIPFIGGILGSALLITLSLLQKMQIGISITPGGFLIPATVGFIGAHFLTQWNLKIRLHNLELEGRVNRRTEELTNLNKTLLLNNQRYTEIFENMSSGVSVLRSTDNGEHFIIVEFNSAAEKIENISRNKIIGKEIRVAFPGVVNFGLFEILSRVYATGKAEFLSAGIYHDSRIQGWRENYVYKLPNGELVAIYKDVTEQKKMEENLELLANTDYLTGISNRRHFVELLDKELKRAKRYDHYSTFLMLDLDHFKTINDTYGHDAGDIVLKEVTKVCLFILREVDEFGRLGGEEFGIFLPDTSLEGALIVAERIRKAIEEMIIPVTKGEITLSISIGVTETNNNLLVSKDVMRIADQALYAAKEQGRNCVVAVNS